MNLSILTSETEHGLSPEAWEALSEALLAEASYPGTAASTAGGQVDRSSPDHVRWVQGALNRLLGLRLATDGISGPMTRSAIRSFQQKKGLKVDGIVGPQTEGAIMAAGHPPPPTVRLPSAGSGGSSYGPTGASAGAPLPSYLPRPQECEVLDRFALNQDVLTSLHQTRITEIARRIVASQGTPRRIRSVRIVGHTDPSGSDDYNRNLGLQRANQVGDALASELERLQPGSGSQLGLEMASKGEGEPVSSTDMGLNRRVEVCLLTTPARKARAGSRWFTTGGTPPMQLVRDGNEVRPLIGGVNTFAEMARVIRTARDRTHYIYLLGWWLSDDFPLIRGDASSTINRMFIDASARGVQIRVMLWDQQNVTPSGATQNTAEINRINRGLSNGAAILDGRLLSCGLRAPCGSHHQKVLIVKGSEGLIGFAGGVDINPDRVDQVGATSGAPLHDVHCRVKGPAAYDLLRIFLERWQDHPDHTALDRAKGALRGLTEAIPQPVGQMLAQVGRTYGNGSRHLGVPGGYQFALNGEQTCRRMILRAIEQARRFIYIEDQYLVSMEISAALQAALPHIQRLIILIPHGSVTFLGRQTNFRRQQFIAPLRQGPDGHKARVFFLSPPTAPGTYVHSKMMVVDDQFAIIGSANLCRRSLTHDSEVTVGFYDPAPASMARVLRVALWARHLNLDTPAGRQLLVNPVAAARYWLSPPAGSRVTPYDENVDIEKVSDTVWDRLIDPDGT